MIVNINYEPMTLTMSTPWVWLDPAVDPSYDAPVTTEDSRFRGELAVADLFPATTLEQWRALAEQGLKGASLDSLFAETTEGVAVRSLYTAGDLSGLEVEPMGPVRRPWQSCQQVRHPIPESAGAEIAESARFGIDAAWLLLDRSVRRALPPDELDFDADTPDGLVVSTAADMSLLLDALGATIPALYLDAGGSALATASVLVAAVKANGDDPAELEGGFGSDPLAALAADGVLPGGLDRALAQLPDVVNWCDRSAPRLRALSVTSLPYAMSGASVVQELAYMMATAVAYLRATTRSSVSVDLTCRHLRFVTTSGRDLLLEIAKLRALRSMWARVVQACGGSDESRIPRVHAVTSPRTLTVRDPWVNLVRTTVEAFGAVVGGSDTVTVLPFDDAIGQPDTLARRIAALTHALLRDESHLHRVIDPTAGSYALERLTADLAEHAWALFQRIEAGGGMEATLIDGTIRRELARIRDLRRRAHADGREPITGVTSHPDPDEQWLDRVPPDVSGQRARLHESLVSRRPPRNELERLGSAANIAAGDGAVMDAAIDACAAGATLWEVAAAIAGCERPTTVEPLPSERDAAPFEDALAPREAS
jgi:methylmalonyl-CoA mutase